MEAFRRALLFAVVAIATIPTFVGIALLFAVFFPNTRLQVGLDFAIGAAVALSLLRVHRRLMVLIDQVFFPRRLKKLGRLHELQSHIEQTTDPDALANLLNRGACRALGLCSAALFLRAGDGGFLRESAVGWEQGTWHVLPDDPILTHVGPRTRFLRIGDVAWTDASVPSGPARPCVVFALHHGREIVALQFYGAHTSGAEVDADEIAGLTGLCHAAEPVIA